MFILCCICYRAPPLRVVHITGRRRIDKNNNIIDDIVISGDDIPIFDYIDIDIIINTTFRCPRTCLTRWRRRHLTLGTSG